MYTANEYTVKWNLLRDAAIRGRTEEALVRVVVFPKDSTHLARPGESAMQSADATAERVAARLITEVDGVLPGDLSKRGA